MTLTPPATVLLLFYRKYIVRSGHIHFPIVSYVGIGYPLLSSFGTAWTYGDWS